MFSFFYFSPFSVIQLPYLWARLQRFKLFCPSVFIDQTEISLFPPPVFHILTASIRCLNFLNFLISGWAFSFLFFDPSQRESLVYKLRYNFMPFSSLGATFWFEDLFLWPNWLKLNSSGPLMIFVSFNERISVEIRCMHPCGHSQPIQMIVTTCLNTRKTQKQINIPVALKLKLLNTLEGFLLLNNLIHNGSIMKAFRWRSQLLRRAR